ncbi:MAG: peptidoglycan DD-metalloendopeptidase family protein [Betaproteobacteria bacterium]
MLRQLAVAALIVVAAAGCATRQPAPVEERTTRPVRPAPAPPPVATPAPEPDWRPREYTVKRGDTLHKLALDFGLDYRDLAAWNGIENVNLIREGQVLRIVAPGDNGPGAAGVTTAPLKSMPPPLPGDARPPSSGPAAPLVVPGPRNADNYKSQPKSVKEPYSEQALRDVQRLASAAPPSVPVPAPEPVVVARAEPKPAPEAKPSPTDAKPSAAVSDDDEKLDWMWPAKGKLVTGFSDTANLKGIDIAGTSGQPVVAGAAGKVVYAGTGLRGYGKLVIIKHNGTYLSAYAHNRDLLVKEGQPVTRGQKIAEMGNTDADQVKLHFEIRRLGKPMDPLKYLPPA